MKMQLMKRDDCNQCDGSGVLRFLSHETEECAEYDTDECKYCYEPMDAKTLREYLSDERVNDHLGE